MFLLDFNSILVYYFGEMQMSKLYFFLWILAKNCRRGLTLCEIGFRIIKSSFYTDF